jgi:transforming growth factor-beta-induced protein
MEPLFILLLVLLLITLPYAVGLDVGTGILIHRFEALLGESGIEVPSGSTLLAPHDAAWDALPKAFREGLGTEGWELQTYMLLENHIIPQQEISSQSFENQAVFAETAGNSTLLLRNRTINTDTELIHVDVSVTTGILHVISGVLVPTLLQNNLYDMLDHPSQNFSRFVQLVQDAGMDDMLQTQGPFTLFAPTNEAMEKAGEDFVNLLTGHPNFLNAFLQHHLLDTQIYDWQDNTTILETVFPTTLFVFDAQDKPGGTAVNDATVYPDQVIVTQNGLIYPITSAMTPPSVASLIQNIHRLTNNVIQLTVFTEVLQNASFLEDLDFTSANLNDPPAVTVFCPTNEAFLDPESQSLYKFLRPPWKAHLQSLVRYHVVRNKYSLQDIRQMDQIQSLSSFKVDVVDTGDDVFLDNATVVVRDIYVYNASLQILDRVLVPPTLTLGIMDQLLKAPQFSLLVELLEKVLLDDLLTSGEGPFTLFAPTNAALESIASMGTPLQIRTLLEYHIVPINFVTLTAKEGNLVTLADLPIQVTFDDNQTVLINGVTINREFDNQLARNGVIHVISELIPIPEGLTREPSASPSQLPSAIPTVATTLPAQDVAVLTDDEGAVKTLGPAVAPAQSPKFAPPSVGCVSKLNSAVVLLALMLWQVL